MDRTVDPWRFAGSFIAKALGSAIPEEPRHPPIPWAPLRKPLSECRVALLSTAGISMRGALEVAVEARAPGHVEHLPFRWHEAPENTKWHPKEPSPIIALIQARRAKREAR